MGRNRQLPHDCPICPRKDRDWIDTLLANGVPYDEVSREFRIAVVFSHPRPPLRRRKGGVWRARHLHAWVFENARRNFTASRG